MSGTVFFREITPPPPDRNEIFRYMQTSATPQAEELLTQCLKEAEGALQYRVCYAEYPVVFGETLDLGFAKTDSADLRKNLKDCNKIILFAATVGIGTDRLIARWQRISPAKALCFSAIGSERVEALCDAFCRQMNGAVPRFSPGYGDLPLEFQRLVFEALNCAGKIGLTLNQSLLMTPEKSVTAILGKKV